MNDVRKFTISGYELIDLFLKISKSFINKGNVFRCFARVTLDNQVEFLRTIFLQTFMYFATVLYLRP